MINGKPAWVKYPESMKKSELISYLKQLRLLKTIHDYGDIIPRKFIFNIISTNYL